MLVCNTESEKKALSSLEELGIFLLIDGVDHEIYKDFVEKIVKWNHRWDIYPELHMIINCYGGDAAATFGMVDFMDWSSIPIHTFANGVCASGAFIIMMAGDKGHRICTPRTQFLSHNFSGGRWGNYPELVASRKWEDMTYEVIIRHYSQHTLLKTEKDIRKHLLHDSDVWLTPEECLEYGVIDSITTDVKDIPKVIYSGYGDKTKEVKGKKKK
jgi:ATP-dependent protease ClpP protease subunit